MLYSAGIKHDKNTLISLFVTEFRIYEKRTILFRLLLGAIIVISAILIGVATPIKGIMIAVGAWFISSTDFPARLRADENIRKFGNEYPKFKYEFKGSNFTITEKKSMNIDYSKVEHLASDKKYIYIFMGRSNAIMLDKNELKIFLKNIDKPITESFESFLEERTCKNFESKKSLISINLFDLWDILKNRK